MIKLAREVLILEHGEIESNNESTSNICYAISSIWGKFFLLFIVFYFYFLDFVEPGPVHVNVWIFDGVLFLSIDDQLDLGRDQVGGIHVLGDVWILCGDYDLADLLIALVMHY